MAKVVATSKDEPIERMIRRFNKEVIKENILNIVKKKKYYEKPSEEKKRRLKMKKQKVDKFLRNY